MRFFMFYIMIFFLLAGIINTIYLKFPQFKMFKNIKKSKNKKTKQAFLLGLATNLGVGNLIGVGAALYYGGPGVIFWMALFAFFASSFAFSETKYAILTQRVINNETRSSTSLVIYHYFKGKLGIVLSIIFATFLVLTNSIFFPPIQVHAIVSTISDNNRLLVGFILLILVIFITNKGTKRILKVTDFLIPIISICYAITIVVLIILNGSNFLMTISKIIASAFDLKSVIASSVLITIEVGISKSLFSHEAGLGTMPSLIGVASKEECDQMCSYQMLSVIIDTVVLCSLTGIYILQVTNGIFVGNVTGVLINCFEISLGKFGLVICKLFIFFFGFSSIIGQYYLGQTNSLYFSFLRNKKDFKIIDLVFKILFYFGIIIGIFMSFTFINNLLDYGMAILGILNIMVIFTIQHQEKKRHKRLKI